jgi:hypothetical protein
VAPTIPDRVPSHFPAGTTVQFSRSLDDYAPADGWAYTIYLNGLTTKFNKAATVQNSAGFLITLLPSDTEGLPAGPYRYCERLTNPGSRLTLTQVEAFSGSAVYLYSTFTGPFPYVGQTVVITGFTNGGNNLTGIITAITGDITGGTITVANGSAVNETHAGLASGAAEVHDIRGDELVINVEPDAASSPAGTYQTFEERTLVVLEAAIGGNLTSGIQSYQIAGRAVSRYQLAELTKLRGMFRAAVWRQQNPGRLGIPYKAEFDLDTESPFPATWVDVTGIDA